jgi:hypothetical protein
VNVLNRAIPETKVEFSTFECLYQEQTLKNCNHPPPPKKKIKRTAIFIMQSPVLKMTFQDKKSNYSNVCEKIIIDHNKR